MYLTTTHPFLHVLFYFVIYLETCCVGFECCALLVAYDMQGGYTALIWAAQEGHTDCARLLIDAGADKNAKIDVRVMCL
jgi:hypothetical protein